MCGAVARGRGAVTDALVVEPAATGGDDEKSAPVTMAAATGTAGVVAAVGAVEVAGVALPSAFAALSSPCLSPALPFVFLLAGGDEPDGAGMALAGSAVRAAAAAAAASVASVAGAAAADGFDAPVAVAVASPEVIVAAVVAPLSPELSCWALVVAVVSAVAFAFAAALALGAAVTSVKP